MMIYDLTAYTYDIHGRLTEASTVTTATDGRDYSASYRYDENANILFYGRYGIIDVLPGGSISYIMENWIVHTFEYDKAGRLLTETCDNSASTAGIFSSSYTYDRNSNITTLRRTGYPTGQTNIRGLVDDLTMTYNGNRLVKVTDNADEVLVEKSFDFHDGAERTTEYLYDKNGNVTHDYNRGITEISYNAVNLPSRIDIIGDRSVEYIYDASGRKLSCLIKEADNYLVEAAMFSLPDGSMLPEPNRTVSSREYIGAYEFENGELLRLNTPYGYWYNGCFVTNYKDYQGNNRNSASYYAYGLPVQGSNVIDQDPYLYGGKEFYPFKGINLYDFSARTYTPDIARFMQPDPKAHDYHWLSPYAYCGGDPINFIDPTGMVRYYVDMTGRIIPREDAVQLQNIGQYAEELTDKDQIVILANDGTAVDVSEMYDAGTIIGVVKNTTIDSDTQAAIPFVSFIIQGDNNATELFEFLSDNITGINNIEYSHFMLGQEGKQGLNYVTTSHKYAGECGGTFLFDSQFKYGYTIRDFIHSHRDSLEPGYKDPDFKDRMLGIYKQFVPNANPIIFKIYLANSQYEKERYRIF